MITRWRLGVTASAVLLLAVAPAAEARLDLKRCGSSTQLRCGRFNVPLTAAGTCPAASRCSSRGARAPARRGHTSAGHRARGWTGPVRHSRFCGATRYSNSALPRPRHHRVTTNAEAAAPSVALPVAPALEPPEGRNAAAACARRLGSRRAFYTSRDTADDIDALRKELGAEKVALYGTSYGTKVSLAYALRYPARVDRLVLDSVAGVDGPDPFYLDSSPRAPRALRALCRGGTAHGRPDVAADLGLSWIGWSAAGYGVG